MACAVAAPVLESSGDFPAWLEAQGVNAEVAQALDSELGIRDYGVLRACIEDGLVRAELLTAARDRLPFGFYAVLRQVVKALQGAEAYDGGTMRWDDAAASSPSEMTLGSLVDVLLALFRGLSRELMLSVQRMGDIDNTGTCDMIAPPENSAMIESDDDTIKDVDGKNLVPEIRDYQALETSPTIKTEAFEGVSDIESLPVQDTVSLQEMGLRIVNVSHVGSRSSSHQQSSSKIQRISEADQRENNTLHNLYTFHPLPTRRIQGQQQPPKNVELVQQNPAIAGVDLMKHQPFMMESNSQEVNGDVSPQKRYECPMCKKRFTWRSVLKYHLRIHTGEKPFRCNVCKRSFTTSGNLRVHERTHTGVKPYRCEICNRCFKQSQHLKGHQRTHRV